MDEERKRWYEEQANAAATHARKSVLEIADDHSDVAEVIETPGEGGPVEDAVRELWYALREGEVLACPHLEHPRPTWAILGERPRRVRCEDCHKLAVAAGIGTSPVCDLCGEGEPMFLGLLATDFLVVSFTSCTDCKAFT